MCLIVDANCFGCVFNSSSKNHEKFIPILNWLIYGKGAKLIYGGTKYKQEVNFRTSSYRGLMGQIERKGRLLPISDKIVDDMAKKIKEIAGDDADFDDEHIVALVAISKCCVVCTNDKRSFPYLKRKDLYPKGMSVPKIYQTGRNAKLCCDKHIVAFCR